MRWLEIFENQQDWDNGVWVHYTDHERMALHYSDASKQFHQDPAGIYFFPEKFRPGPYWLKKKYAFYITLKDSARILDLGSLNEDQIKDLTKMFGAEEWFEEQIKQYPPENLHRMMKSAWGLIRQKMLGNYVKWNTMLRKAGWDAIFDDTDSIHVGEIQLLILNPSIIKTIKKVDLKPEVFKNISKVVDELKAVFSKYGDVEVEEPRLRKERYGSDKEISASIRVENGEKYATFNVTFRKDHKVVQVGMRYSNPSLRYGVGATYDTKLEKWDNSGGINWLLRDMDKIFLQSEAS